VVQVVVVYNLAVQHLHHLYLSYTNQNNLTVTLKSFTKSGVVPIKVETSFIDVNGKVRTLEKVYNKIILSGPPTAISISYAGTDIDEANAKFIEKMVITITDKYFNLVNTQPVLSASIIAGYTNDTVGNRLYHTSSDTSTATIDPTTDTITISGGVDISNVNPYTDIIATFGKGYTFQASGNWNIDSVNGSNTINLGDDFNVSSSVSNLGYAIGHNYRQDTCRDSAEWIGTVSVVNENKKFDINGMARVNIYYDYYLTGKDVVFAVFDHR